MKNIKLGDDFMKFQDIPQIIRDGEWECDFTLKGLVREIEKMQIGEEFEKALELNPKFQRGHVWTKEQQSLFIESLLQGGAKHSRVIYLNCPDWNCNNKTDYHDFVCVDGLQRYTAIQKFMNNEIKAFGLYLDEYEDVEIFKRRFLIKLNINNLHSEKEVLEWYLQINDGGTPHTKEEIIKVKNMLNELEG